MAIFIIVTCVADIIFVPCYFVLALNNNTRRPSFAKAKKRVVVNK
jgi:hypothetical protein